MQYEIHELPEVQQALLAWHSGAGLSAPWRQSGDPYEVLVAAVMAQQTQMSRVLPAYERFIAAFPTLEALAAATTADVIRAWAGMGYNQRALRLHRAARRIAAEGWPRDAASLAQIEGIGPFTAAIIASFAFGEPAACVDTNVRRVLGRLAGDEHIAARPLQQLADAAIARDHPARWNQALMDYGARICLPRPRCDICIVAEHCAWRARNNSSIRMVAEERAQYRTRRPPRQKRSDRYEGSHRYYRGRAVELLCALSSGERLPLDALPALLAGEHGAPDRDQTRAIVDGLVRDGLAMLHHADGTPAVSLPED